MSKADEYRAILRTLDHWDAYLLEMSGLPGPRGNLDLAQVVADEGDLKLFRRYTAYTADQAPVNSPDEFLAFCGVVGLGRCLTEGHLDLLETLRTHVSDPRWRIREAVAMALQRLGDANMEQLLAAIQAWSRGSSYEQRATAVRPTFNPDGWISESPAKERFVDFVDVAIQRTRLCRSS